MSTSISYTATPRSVTVLKQPFQEDNMASKEIAAADSSVEDTPKPFCVEDDFTDVELEVEGEKLFTNRSLLAFASPVFSCMFTSDFKEKTDRVVSLPYKDYNAVQDMLCFLHPGVEFKFSMDNVFRLIPLAEEYQISVLKSACEDFLLQHTDDQLYPSAEYLVRCLETAEGCSLTTLLTRCIDRLSEPGISLKELKASEKISLETKAAVFEQRIEKLESVKVDSEIWKMKIRGVQQRLREIVSPHDDHCRCRVEVKLRSSVQRVCQYCTRNWCSDNISTEAYRNSYKFFCNHKIGYHICHDAAIRTFMDQDGV